MVGVVLKSKFVFSDSKKFSEYVSYINRNEAVRNTHFEKYSAYVSDYMDNPSKQPDMTYETEKTSALFTRTQDSLTTDEKKNLQDAFTTAQKNKSPMWQNVISFDNRFLREHGLYDPITGILDENKMREVTRSAMDQMLKREQMQESAVWSAAIHYNTRHIHVHIAVVEPSPTRQQIEFTRQDRQGNLHTATEYRAKLKPGTLDAMKSQVVNRLVDQSVEMNCINRLIRESIIGGKQQLPSTNQRSMKKQFLQIYRNLPPDKRLWNYNMNAMATMRPQLDALTDFYIQKFRPVEYRQLLDHLSKQENYLATAYGSGETKKYLRYKESKLEDLHVRMGNVLLKELRAYDRLQKQKLHSKSPRERLKRYRRKQTASSQFVNSLKKALQKDFKSLMNESKYDRLLRDIDRTMAEHEF